MKETTLYNECLNISPVIALKDSKHKTKAQVPLFMVYEYHKLGNISCKGKVQLKDFKNGKATYEANTEDLTEETLAFLDKEIGK